MTSPTRGSGRLKVCLANTKPWYTQGNSMVYCHDSVDDDDVRNSNFDSQSNGEMCQQLHSEMTRPYTKLHLDIGLYSRATKLQLPLASRERRLWRD